MIGTFKKRSARSQSPGKLAELLWIPISSCPRAAWIPLIRSTGVVVAAGVDAIGECAAMQIRKAHRLIVAFMLMKQATRFYRRQSQTDAASLRSTLQERTTTVAASSTRRFCQPIAQDVQKGAANG
ncbi:MAG: hypothetical protein NXI24_15800 [bacterium]|nr:hypothetical protein [bacterium]